MGVAAESISFVCGLSPGLTSNGGKVRVNLGPGFAHPVPPGHASVHEWIQGMRALLGGPPQADAGPAPPLLFVLCYVRIHIDISTYTYKHIHIQQK